MRGNVLSLDTWLDPEHQLPDSIYLDGGDWSIFTDWLSQDHSRARKLHEGKWKVRIFRNQLNRHYGGDGHRNKNLANLGIEFEKADIHKSDEMFIAEALRVYFHNDPAARAQAELLTLARREAGNGWITLISQHRGFWRIPMVNTYFSGTDSLRGRDDLPAQFDFLSDFRIHRELTRAVEERLENTPYGDAVLAGIIALRNHVQRRSGLQEDGRNLMERAFKRDGSNLRLNPLTDPNERGSQKNEQRGFRELYCGVMTGIRNPLAHEAFLPKHDTQINVRS